MSYIGQIHTDVFPDWEDIDEVDVYIIRDGGAPELIESGFIVPSEQVDDQQVYTMEYEWTITAPEATTAYLRYVPAGYSSDISPVNGNSFSIEYNYVPATASESIPISEDESASATFPVSFVEPVSISETQEAVGTFPVSETESIPISEDANASVVFPVTSSESVGIIESTDAAVGNFVTGLESIGVSETQDAVGTFSVSETESIPISEDSNASVVFTVSGNESIGIIDDVEGSATFSVSAAESMGTADSTDASIVNYSIVTESMGVIDDSDAVIVFAVNETESIGITESASASLVFSASVEESVGAEEETTGSTGVITAQITESLGIEDNNSFNMSLLSAAEILRAIIVEDEIGVLRSLDSVSAWPVFVSHLPDEPDNSICVYDTSGIQEGRIQATGESINKPGWQVRVRGVSFENCMNKMYEIADCMDGVLRRSVHVRNTTNLVQAITKTGTILPLGQNNDKKRRYHFTLNGTVTYT